MKILVCYDIPEQKIRRKVAKYLEGHGHRLQRSVFCIEEDTVPFAELCQHLQELSSLSKAPAILLTPLCRTCAMRTFQIGQPKESSKLCVVV